MLSALSKLWRRMASSVASNVSPLILLSKFQSLSRMALANFLWRGVGGVNRLGWRRQP